MIVDPSLGRASTHPLHGEYDLASAPDLAMKMHRLVDESRGHVILDCEHLRFWDSSAVAVLIETQQRLRAQARDLSLVNVADGPRRVLEVLGLLERFGVDGP